jgi:predicted ribosome quality control (RQC) complex YloA/Tae2 family protein
MKYLRKFFEGKKDKFTNIKKMEIDGYFIYLGRDSKSNDHLTFNIAEESDIWLHAKGVPGSHVVIKAKDKLVTPEIIKQAAIIAKKNSKGKDIQDLSIVYCKRKFVKKESNMKDGQVVVDYKNAQEIIL